MAKSAADLTEQPHVRYNPLKGEWVLVSPHRLKRPWQGQVRAPRIYTPTWAESLSPLRHIWRMKNCSHRGYSLHFA